MIFQRWAARYVVPAMIVALSETLLRRCRAEGRWEFGARDHSSFGDRARRSRLWGWFGSTMHGSTQRLRIAVDIGGTFTDLAVFDEGKSDLSFGKALSTHDALVDGIRDTLKI